MKQRSRSQLILCQTKNTDPAKISEAEKNLVVGQIKNCLLNNVVYISNTPEYHKIEKIADHVARAWTIAKTPQVAPHEQETFSLWKSVAQVRDRERFKNIMNDILSKVSSHFWIEDASEDLEKAFKTHPLHGIKYEKTPTLGPPHSYIVRSVKKGSIAHLEGIKPKDVFYLTGPRQVPLHHTNLPKGMLKEKLIVKFYRNGRFFKYLRLRSISPPWPEISEYKIDEEYVAKKVEKYNKNSENYVYIPIRSFLDNYPGMRIASTFEALSRLNGQGKVENLIIDLRGNGGGWDNNLRHLLSYFIQPGVPYGSSITRKVWNAFHTTELYKNHITKQEDSTEIVQPALFKSLLDYALENYPELVTCIPVSPMTTNRWRFSGKVAILVDETTASSAESFTIIMKNLFKDRCIIIGKKTSGELLTSYLPYYAGTFKIVYPAEDFIPIGGTRVEGNGINPDILLEDTSTKRHQEEAKKWFKTNCVTATGGEI